MITRSETGIFSNEGDNFMTDSFTSPVFALVVAFILDLQIRKFQEDLIKA